MDPVILDAKINEKMITYNSKIDLWSIGVVFYFFLTGEYIFGTGGVNSVKKNIEKLISKSK